MTNDKRPMPDTEHRAPKIAAAATLLVLALSAPLRSDAAIVFLKGSDEPLYVLTIREDAAQYVVGVPAAGGKFTQRIIEKREVDDFIRTVSAERLAELSPDTPAAYRDYAEELAAKRIDPDARTAAIRLYLIAAYLDPENLGRSSLLGMAALARSEQEQRKFRAMVYLLDPRHDRGVLEMRTSPAAAASEAAASEERDALVAALRLLRQGSGRVAERMVQRPAVAAALERYGGGLTQEEFFEACRATDALPPQTLARLIRLELELTGGRSERPSAELEESTDWSAAVAAGRVQPVPSLSLETLTEFDPRKSLYRDGEWVAARSNGL